MNFLIRGKGAVSAALRLKGIEDFKSASTYIQHLPYRRNKNKEDVLCVMKENCGTCSTKNVLLKALADENGFSDAILTVGIYRMNASNTPKVKAILEEHKLSYLPEAHCYIKHSNRLYDFTWSKSNVFVQDIIEEFELDPENFHERKLNLHKKFLEDWRVQQKLNVSADQLWEIREACIAALGQ